MARISLAKSPSWLRPTCAKIYRDKVSERRLIGRNWPSCCAPSVQAMLSSFPDLTGWRSTRDLLNVLDAIFKAGAGLRSLKDTWTDTTTPHGRC
jgi:hypothetical protein